MAQELLTERYPEQIAGVISCWDRVVIRGMLTTLGCPDGMTAYLAAATALEALFLWGPPAEITKP